MQIRKYFDEIYCIKMFSLNVFLFLLLVVNNDENFLVFTISFKAKQQSKIIEIDFMKVYLVPERKLRTPLSRFYPPVR